MIRDQPVTDGALTSGAKTAFLTPITNTTTASWPASRAMKIAHTKTAIDAL
jgi:hypothetical protein